MLKWCPCMGWCLTESSPAGEAKVLLNAMATPSYNVRRISSFGQTIINAEGEEEEVVRHGTVPTSLVKDQNGPPWSASPIPVQPGVTKSDVAVRMQRMTSIPEIGSPRARGKLRKSLSESDRCSADGASPARTRRRVPTPQEFAQPPHDDNSDKGSVSSFKGSITSLTDLEHKKKTRDDLPVDDIVSVHQFIPGQQVNTNHQAETKGEKKSSLFNLVKSVRHSDASVKSPRRRTISCEDSTTTSTPRSNDTLSPKESTKHDEQSRRRFSDICEREEREDVDGRPSSRDDATAEEFSVAGTNDTGSQADEDDYSTSLSHNNSRSTLNLEELELDEVTLDGSRQLNSGEIARQYGLDLSMYEVDTGLTSYGQNDYDLSANISIARIFFSVNAVKEKNQIVVCIEKVEGLGGEGVDNVAFDVIFRLGLLKGGHEISTKPAASDKPINQTVSLHVKDLATSVLRLSVYHHSWQGSQDALGHALFRLSKSTQSVSHHNLNVSPKSCLTESAGMIEISFRVNSNVLYLIVHKITDILPAYRGFKVYVKVCLYVSSRKAKERVSKTEVSQKDCASFDFEAKFKADGLRDQHVFVIVSLKKKPENNKIFKHDKSLGRVVLGPLFYTANKINLWGKAVLLEKIVNHNFSMYL